jgi:hypothetical protein
MTVDHFSNLQTLRLPPGMVPEKQAVPAKARKWRRHYALLPWNWIEKLAGVSGTTFMVAVVVRYLHWKEKGQPIKLANSELASLGVSRFSKWTALSDLERRGLITVERRPKRSPIVRVVG